MSATYESSDIQALGDLQAIRTRPGMYISDMTSPRQLLIEALDNALDEVQGGHSDKAIVKLDTKENKYSVQDHGRGIPIGTSKYVDPISGETHDIETLKLLYFKNHAGGKFGNTEAYKKSRGLHGVGNKCINALSSSMMARTVRDGKAVKLTTSKGIELSLDYENTTDPNGMYVEFIPDKDMFESDIISDNDLIEATAIPRAFGLDVELYKDDKLIDLPYKDLFDLLPVNDNENELMRTQFSYENPSTTESIIVALKYTSDTNTLYRGYTNMIYQSSGGTHLRFFDDCYREAWSKYVDNDFKLQDVFIGLRVLVGVSIDNKVMAFNSQTKDRLTTNKAYFDQWKVELVKMIQKWFDDHEAERKGLIKRFKEYRASQNKLLANKELSSMIYINTESNGVSNIRRKSVVDKLLECTNKAQAGTSLIICEGDSAAGTLIQARDIKYHAILPIRGKILNVSKVGNYITAMKNEEVKSIVNSAGTGIGTDCDYTLSRYEKYLIFCDADADGLQIASLLVSVFVNLLPGLVNAGMVYVVVPPLYGWTDKNGKHYSNDLNDVTNLSTMTRYKGLGEMDPEDMQESCLDPNNQHLIQVEFPTNIDDFNESMTSSSVKYNILNGLGLIKEIEYVPTTP